MNEKSLNDIAKYLEAIPYGDVVLTIKRVNRKTVLVSTEAGETLRYNPEEPTDPRKDLNLVLDNLTNTGYSGEVSLKLDYIDGHIKLLTIYDKKQTKY